MFLEGVKLGFLYCEKNMIQNVSKPSAEENIWA
jgi:hypothetical protein